MTKNEKCQPCIEYGSIGLWTMTHLKGRSTRKVRYLRGVPSLGIVLYDAKPNWAVNRGDYFKAQSEENE